MSSGDLDFKEYTFPSGTVYRGGFRGKKKEGKGYWRHPEGETYEGEYHENRQHGWGTYTFADSGKQYIGHWREGEMDGEGIYIFNKEATEYYIGEYKSDRKHGTGMYQYGADKRVTIQEWRNGDLISEEEAPPERQFEFFKRRLEIQFQCDSVCRNLTVEPSDKIENEWVKRLVRREHTYPSGAKYVGTFLGVKKHGEGHWCHPEGDTYEGQFRYNKHDGWGVYLIGKTKKKYVGAWRDGRMDGWGVYYFTDDETEYFVGTYKSDAKDGFGVYTFPSGVVKFQRWENGFMKEEIDANDLVIEAYEKVRKNLVETVLEHCTEYKPKNL